VVAVLVNLSGPPRVESGMTMPFTPEDRTFIRALLDHPEDRMTWLVYADWLDERGWPLRAEFLRLTVQRGEAADDDPRRGEIDQRLAALRAEVDADWAVVFDAPRIGNCWRPPGCPLRWDRLVATDVPDIRRCLECNRPVFYCHTVEEAGQFVSSGERVAVSSRAFPAAEVPFGEPEQLPLGVVEFDDDDDAYYVPEPPVSPPPAPPPAPRPWWKFW
jgi:uncharacterized protein (TIGR02996 family)